MVTFLPFKEYFDLSKVHSSLSKVRVSGKQLPLPLRGLGMSHCGTSSALRAQTASPHQE